MFCFQTSRIPSMWAKMSSPIRKYGNKDKRDPMSYHGISLASTM